MANTEYRRMRQLIGTTLEWAANDLVIGDGELAAERIASGEVQMKVGDGARKYSALPYISTSAAGLSPAVSAELLKYLRLSGGQMTGELKLIDQVGGGSSPVLPDEAISRAWAEKNIKGDWATVPEVQAGVVTNKGVVPAYLKYAAINAGGNPAAGDKIVKTEATGFISNTFIDSTSVGGPANAGRVVKLDSAGNMPSTLFPPRMQGAMFFKGDFDPSAGTEYPLNPKEGDTWYLTNAAKYTFKFGDLTTLNGLKEDLIVFDGSRWHLVGKDMILLMLDAYVAKNDTVATSAGNVDANKVPKLNTAGKLDLSLMIDSGYMFFKGEFTPTAALEYPATPKRGDTYGLSNVAKYKFTSGDLLGKTGLLGDAIVFDGFAWHIIGKEVVYTILNDYILKTDPIAVSTGAPDAGKYVKLDSTGKFDLSLLVDQGFMYYRGDFTPATSAEYPTSPVPKKGDVYTLANSAKYKFTSGSLTGKTGLLSDAMVYDGAAWHLIGKEVIYTILNDYILKTDPIAVSTGVADAGKFIKLDGNGVIDNSFLSIPGGMVFKGAISVTAAAPTGHKAGDFYIASAAGTADASWTGIGGKPIIKGDALLWDGTKWDALSADLDLSSFVVLDGSKPMTGPLTLPSDPTGALQATPKQYVDAIKTALTNTMTTDFLSKADAAATYLTQTSATSNYLSKTDAASTYLSQTNAASTFLSKTDAATQAATYETAAHAASTFLSQTTAASTYQTQTAAANYLTKADAATIYATAASVTAAGGSSLTTTAADAKYQTKTQAATEALLYETKVDAAAAHALAETQVHAAATYLSKADAATTYQTIANVNAAIAALTFLTSAQADAKYLTKTDAASTYMLASLASTFALKTDLAKYFPLTDANSLIARVVALETKTAPISLNGSGIRVGGPVVAAGDVTAFG